MEIFLEALAFSNQPKLVKYNYQMFVLFFLHKACLAGIYMCKVNKRNTSTMSELFSKLTIKTPERCNWCRSGVFIVNFEHI